MPWENHGKGGLRRRHCIGGRIMLFIVYGEPVAKGRPKFSRQGNFVKTYTPSKTTNYENLVKLTYQEACLGEMKLMEGEVSMKIDAFFPIPKSTSVKKRQQMNERQIRHTKRPDADNLAKAICDALNNIAYVDDNQIVHLEVNKYYSEQPRVEVTIEEVQNG